MVGADVTVTLVAHDEAGNEGRSAPTEFKLPQRLFTKPVAKALIEQRRTLALDADSRDRVVIALDALSIEPEKFAISAPVYSACVPSTGISCRPRRTTTCASRQSPVVDGDAARRRKCLRR